MISVLCVDDEPGLLKIAKIFLERDKDLTVKTVTSAIEGLAVISTESFDAIVSDYQMPEMDGIEFLKRVRSLNCVPFILFTGRGREEVAIEAINNGVDFYLQKGLEPKSQFAELAHKIKHAVNKRRLEDLLVKSEQKFHTFADYTHDWEYWQAEDNAYVYISPSCEQITGYTAEEFNADPQLLSSIIYPDDRVKWTHHLKEEYQLDAPLALEFRIVRKDGETRWISHRCQPVTDTSGKLLGRRTGNRDITRQKQDEEKIFVAYRQLAAQDELLKQQYGSLRMVDVIQKENSRFFDNIFSSIQDGISVLDPDLTILKVNATMERWYAHSMPLVGKKCHEAYHFSTGPCTTCPTLQTLKTGKATMETVPLIGPDSATVGWIDLYSFPLIDSQTGKMNGIIEYVRDITQRRRAELELATSEERYRRLFESSKDGILILDYETGSIVDANPFILAMLGQSRKELIGKTLAEIGLLEDALRAEKTFAALQKEEYVRYENLPLQAKDGSSIAVEFISTVYPVNHGRVIQCNIRDITERVRIERELQRSEEQYRTIIETAHEGIWKMDEHCVTALINPRLTEILGYSPEEMIGHKVTDFMFPEDLPEHRKRVGSRMKGEPEVYEQKFRHKNGNPVLCRVSATPRMDNRQGFRGSFAMLSDITTRRRSEEAVRESDERFRNLIQNSSDMIRIINRNGIIAYSSPSTPRLVGFNPSDVIGKDPLDYVHPDDRDRVKGAIDEVFNNINPGTPTEYRILHADGHYIDVESIATNLLNVRGIEGVVTTTRLITERKRAEEALKKAYALLNETQEISHLGGWEFDAATVRVTWTDEVYRIHGVGPDFDPGFINRNIQFYSLQDLPVIEQAFQRCLERGESYDLEAELIRADGKKILVRTMGRPVMADGMVIRIRGNIIDITERKQAEQELRESEERFRTLFEKGPLGMAFSSDSLRFIKVNPAFCAMLGYSEEEMSGMSFTDITHPDHRESDITGVKKLSADEIPLYATEKRYLTKSGKIIWASTTVSVIRDVAGTFLYYLAFIENISDRKKTEFVLMESEAKYRDLVENANTIIMQTNTEGKITYFNEFAQKFFGFSEPEILGRSLIGTIMPEIESVTGRELGYMIKDEIDHPEKYALHETEIIKKDGGLFWVAWRNKPQYDEEGILSGIVRYGLDITDRRKAEEALFQTNKKLNLLSSITRHDILNQLTALSGYIELSKAVVQDKKMLEFIQHEKRATNTIQRLISFTKDYQDIGQYRPMWQNVQTIVHLLAKTVELNATNLIITVSHLEIFADPLLEKVIYTLLENAMRHGGPPKTIRFSYQLVDKGCLIICEDDGIGVEAADKEKIFERGYGKHTGFGLFLSREILGITGFSIQETGNPGKGARFEIFVPNGSFRLEQKNPQ